ncbi:MAG: hypothetical protein AB7F86_03905 [Bdellovibrionales bacterium]
MRLSSSTYSSFKSLSSLVITGLLAVSCQKTTDRTITRSEATGKGNGGNGLTVTQAEIDRVFADLKPKLKISFEALSFLAKAEKAAPKSTELSESPELLKTIAMLTQENDVNVFLDLDTKENFARQEAPCMDFRGVPKAASAVLLEVGGKICFSNRQLRSTSVKNFDKAAEIMIIGLAAHELTHHFISSGDHAKDEKAATDLQNFLEQQLVRGLELEAKDIVSIDDSDYIARFYQRALDVYTSAIEQPGARK